MGLQVRSSLGYRYDNECSWFRTRGETPHESQRICDMLDDMECACHVEPRVRSEGEARDGCFVHLDPLTPCRQGCLGIGFHAHGPVPLCFAPGQKVALSATGVEDQASAWQSIERPSEFPFVGVLEVLTRRQLRVEAGVSWRKRPEETEIARATAHQGGFSCGCVP
jgi:hypothetical protein